MNKEQRELLKLNLQHFSSGEDGAGETGEGEVLDTTKGENAGSENSDNNNTPEVDKTIPYDRFKAKVDEANLLKEKLAKLELDETTKQNESLLEQEKYKELYENSQLELQVVKDNELKTRKDSLIKAAGYTPEQSTLLSKLVDGASDEEIVESIELLKETFPIKKADGVDPALLNSRKDKITTSNKEVIGSDMYERLKNKIK